MHRKATLLTVVVVALGSLTFACSSEEPPKEDVGITRDAICSGGGGGDSCVSTDGFCPAECGVCYNSIQQKIELQNMWECTSDPGGGGGGGGGEACSSPTSYTGWGDEYNDDREFAERQAIGKAEQDAQSRCQNSASFCRANVGTTTSSSLGCAEIVTPGYYRWHCRAQATTQCTYSWPSPW